MGKPWYEELYRDFADYDQEPYTQGTQGQVDFIERIIGYDRSKRILDVGCGAGRHALELSRRGYPVVGIDLSPSMLEQGRKIAAAEQLTVEFVQGDARRMVFNEEFDVAVILCEGAFSLVETDEMDRMILVQVAQALRPGGVLVMTAPNAAHMLAQGQSAGAFDPVTLRETFTLEKTDSQGIRQLLECTQRYYTCPELGWMLKDAGFGDIEFFAVRGSSFERHGRPSPTDFEFGVIAFG
jgi:2-polyprenyl-3-methyl-5-hydroxy-6-metoxy-1,4-benzoquinol methylase